MTRSRRHLVGGAGLAVGALVLSACSGGITSASFSVTPTTVAGVTLSSEQSPAGRILATPGGRTLYDFTPDTSGSSACVSGLCVRLWPPLLTSGRPTTGKGLEQSLVGTIRRPNGSLQVTYAGHPLYSWIGDSRPGMVTGQALLNQGGYWYVISTGGREIKTTFSVEATALRT